MITHIARVVENTEVNLQAGEPYAANYRAQVAYATDTGKPWWIDHNGLLVPLADNFYTVDGTMDANRTADLDSFDLSFINAGTVQVDAATINLEPTAGITIGVTASNYNLPIVRSGTYTTPKIIRWSAAGTPEWVDEPPANPIVSLTLSDGTNTETLTNGNTLLVQGASDSLILTTVGPTDTVDIGWDFTGTAQGQVPRVNVTTDGVTWGAPVTIAAGSVNYLSYDLATNTLSVLPRLVIDVVVSADPDIATWVAGNYTGTEYQEGDIIQLGSGETYVHIGTAVGDENDFGIIGSPSGAILSFDIAAESGSVSVTDGDTITVNGTGIATAISGTTLSIDPALQDLSPIGTLDPAADVLLVRDTDGATHNTITPNTLVDNVFTNGPTGAIPLHNITDGVATELVSNGQDITFSAINGAAVSVSPTRTVTIGLDAAPASDLTTQVFIYNDATGVYSWVENVDVGIQSVLTDATLTGDGVTTPLSVVGSTGGVVTYDAGNGAIVTASDTGITFTRTSSTEGTFSIPDGVELFRGDIHHSQAQNPGADYYIRFAFAGTRLVNNDLDDISPPWVRVLNKSAAVANGDVITRAAPVIYNQTAGSINLELRVTSTTGYLEINLKNYNDSRVAGSGESSIMFMFR